MEAFLEGMVGDGLGLALAIALLLGLRHATDPDHLTAVSTLVLSDERAAGRAGLLGLFWGLELVRNRETREPLVPFNATGEAAKPIGAVAKRALDRGLYLMTHWNVAMCCPPLTITREELDEGLAALDDALSVADEFAA